MNIEMNFDKVPQTTTPRGIQWEAYKPWAIAYKELMERVHDLDVNGAQEQWEEWGTEDQKSLMKYAHYDFWYDFYFSKEQDYLNAHGNYLQVARLKRYYKALTGIEMDTTFHIEIAGAATHNDLVECYGLDAEKHEYRHSELERVEILDIISDPHYYV